MKSSYPIYKLFLFFTIFLTLFPYLKTSTFSSDVQPHSIIIILFFLLIQIVLTQNKYIIKKYTILFLGIFIISLNLLLLLDAEILDYFRILFFIISFFIFFKIYPSSISVIYYAVTISTIIYFIGALFQLFLGTSILETLVSNLRFSSGRGLTSFTSEPSFFGLVSLTHILILELTKKRNFRFFQFINLLCILLSGSMYVILPTFIILFLYILQFKNAWKLQLIYGFVVLIFILLMTLLYPEMRAIKLLKLFSDDPTLFLNDISMKNRLLRSFGPLYLSYDNSFMPHSFSNISNRLPELTTYINDKDVKIDRLSNIFTYLIYPFGFFALILLCYSFYILCKLKVPLFLIFSVLFFSMGNITIITTYVTMLIAFIFAHYWNKKKRTY